MVSFHTMKDSKQNLLTTFDWIYVSVECVAHIMRHGGFM